MGSGWSPFSQTVTCGHGPDLGLGELFLDGAADLYPVASSDATSAGGIDEHRIGGRRVAVGFALDEEAVEITGRVVVALEVTHHDAFDDHGLSQQRARGAAALHGRRR